MVGRDEVLVIGAGPAGIACAAALEEAGIACCVIDQAHVIGSTWDKPLPVAEAEYLALLFAHAGHEVSPALRHLRLGATIP